MKNILAVMENASQFDIHITEVELTEDQARQIVNEVGTPMPESQQITLEKLNTEFGEVKIKIKNHD